MLQGDVAAFRAAATAAVYADESDKLAIDELLVRVAYSGGCSSDIEYEIMLSIGYPVILKVCNFSLYDDLAACNRYISLGAINGMCFNGKRLLRGPG